jgi:hypothetical protein
MEDSLADAGRLGDSARQLDDLLRRLAQEQVRGGFLVAYWSMVSTSWVSHSYAADNGFVSTIWD